MIFESKKPGLIFESWFFCCPLNEKCSAKNLLDDQEVKQHQQAKDDAIPSEDLDFVDVAEHIKNNLPRSDIYFDNKYPH